MKEKKRDGREQGKEEGKEMPLFSWQYLILLRSGCHLDGVFSLFIYSLFNEYLVKTNQVTKFAISLPLESGLAL